MLKVRESVDGKFDIVLSDGYKSQLHKREKAAANIEPGYHPTNRKSKVVNKTSKTKTEDQLHGKKKLQKTSSHDTKDAVGSAGPRNKKPSRMAAKFQNAPGRNKSNGDKVNNPSNLTNENSAYVTRDDLARLLNALTNNPSQEQTKHIDAVPVVVNEQNKTDVKLTESSLKQTTETKPVDTRSLKMKSTAEPVTTATTMTENNSSLDKVPAEVTKPAAMRSSFAIGAPGLVVNNPNDDKAARHRKWIHDLEEQIQAKKEKEQKGKSNEYESTYFTSQTKPVDTRSLKMKSTAEPVTTATTTTENNSLLDKVPVEVTKPAAMTSSFAIGAPGLVVNNPNDDKAARHRKWIHDLEEQIQAKKEKEQKGKSDEYESTYFTSQATATQQRVGSIASNKADHRAKTVAESFQQQERTENSMDTHGRGRGLKSIVSADRTEKQRQKIVEHQKAIEQQVEDRRRRKQEETERRLKEDAMEEARLARETAALQKQFDEELRKNREKEEQAKNRVRVLQEGITQAFESAQQLKREKRNQLIRNSGPEGGTTSRTRENPQDTFQDVSTLNRSVNRSHKLSPKREAIPPLNLSSSYSHTDMGLMQGSNNVVPISTSREKETSLERCDVRTSHSEPVSLRRSRDLFNQWAEEDVGKSGVIDDQYHIYEESGLAQSSDRFIPYLRTASATLLSQSVTSQDNDVKTSQQNARYEKGKERKMVKKGRTVPDVQPTRTSLLRNKATNSNNELKNPLPSRLHHEVVEPQLQKKTVQKQKPKQDMLLLTKSTSLHDETRSLSNERNPLVGESKMMNYTPGTPTAHQERILEQLSTLRKGLMMKDQELMARMLSVGDNEIPV